MSSALGIISLGLSIATAVLLVYTIHHSGSDKLALLKERANLVQTELNALTANIPNVQECDEILVNVTRNTTECFEYAIDKVSNNTVLLTNLSAVLAQNEVSGFNNTVFTHIQEQTTRIMILQTAILEAIANQTETVPRILQNGTVFISMSGGDNFTSTYNLKRLVLGDLRMTFIELQPWPYSLRTYVAMADPTIRIDQFTPPVMAAGPVTGDVLNPLISSQASRVQWVNPDLKAVSYRWKNDEQALEIYNKGMTEVLNTVALVRPLTVVFQYL